MSALRHPNDGSWKKVLERLGLLGRFPEKEFDHITRLAAIASECPIALLTFFSTDHHWIGSSFGIASHAENCDATLFEHVTAQNGVLTVEDAQLDTRFSSLPFVTGPPHVRFYAGCPVCIERQPIGTLSVFGNVPQKLQSREQSLLMGLGALAGEIASAHLNKPGLGRESERSRREAFDNAPVGLAIVGLDGRYLRVNPFLCRITGYSADEMLAVKEPDITHPDDREGDLEHAQLLDKENRTTLSREKRFISKGGKIVWVAITATLVHDHDDTPLHYVSQVQDITERRATDHTKTDFLATAAHELRSPLSSVYGFSELLLQKNFQPDKQRELLAIIYDQAQRMTRLINDLLDLARMESKRGLDFHIAPHAPAAVIGPIVRGFRVPGREPPALEVESGLPAVCVDADKTAQALTNILSNAFKYSSVGTPVTVRVNRSSDSQIAVSIRDQGIGISKSELPKVFERFYRIDNSSVTGTGLGMTLVKEIAERQGGGVRIDSEIGKGTEVTLLLPAEK